MSFHELGLSAELLRAVAEEGYSEPTPVQRHAIPAILRGRDVRARAQTGTGKTAGFALPLLHVLSSRSRDRNRPDPSVLVLTPTRELASQVEKSFQVYGRYLPLKTAVVFGGVDIRPQIERLRRGIDILVATPGRLMDHIGRNNLGLSRIETLVLDEADRMLDMGFLPDIRKILSLLPRNRQNLLFSATFPAEIERLAGGILSSPVRIELAPRNAAAETISQVVHPVTRQRKRALLSKLIRAGSWKQVLVFTRTKRRADRLSRDLARDGFDTAAIHGNKSQRARTRALTAFKRGELRVLVATDVAARGLDIKELPHVVNFELPDAAEDYVHRIGRTGRAGIQGRAVSLVCTEEREQLKGIERLLRLSIPKEIISDDGTGGLLELAPPLPHPASRERVSRQPRRRRKKRARRIERLPGERSVTL